MIGPLTNSSQPGALSAQFIVVEDGVFEAGEPAEGGFFDFGFSE
jgi:hypothetical protein